MIVRNEEQNLQACLEPVRGLVDETIVVDTGSSDRTREVARGLGARVEDFPWCDDFAAARNESLRHASGDWVLWLDADDRLDANNLQRLACLRQGLTLEPRAYVMDCVCPGEHPTDTAYVISQIRLFRHHPEARWRYRVHEQILPSLSGLGYEIHRSEVEITHVGYLDAALEQRKNQRNLRLLRLEYLTNPDDPVVLHFLGMTSLRMGSPGQALTYLLRGLELAGEGAGDWLRAHHLYLAQALRRTGQAEQSLAALAEGLERFPGDQALLLERADLLSRVGDLGGVERALLQLLRTPPTDHLRLGPCDTTQRREARRLLGMLYLDTGRWVEAERELQELLAEHPVFVQGWVSLAYVYLNTRQTGRFEFALRQVEKCPGGEVFASVLVAEAAIAAGDFASACKALEGAVARAPKMLWPRLVRAEMLQKSGAPAEELLAAHRDILRLDPGNPASSRQIALLEAGRTETSFLDGLYTSIDIGPGFSG